MMVGMVSGLGWELSVGMVAGLEGAGGRSERKAGGEREVVWEKGVGG